MPMFEESHASSSDGFEHIDGLNGDAETRGKDVEPIAIIGLSLKFPQEAVSAESFWKMLLEGRSAMTEMPKDRFNLEAYYHPDSEKPGMVSPKPIYRAMYSHN